MTGDVHLVFLDGEFFIPFLRSPGAGDHAVLEELINREGHRPMGYGRRGPNRVVIFIWVAEFAAQRQGVTQAAEC